MKRERIAVLIIAAIAALSFAAIILHGFLLSGAETAVIYKNGEIVRELDLSGITEPVEFTIEGDNGETNTVRAERGRIRVTEASCPDKICVDRGWIDNGVIPIVCLPNKLTIEIRGGVDKADQIDAVTGG